MAYVRPNHTLDNLVVGRVTDLQAYYYLPGAPPCLTTAYHAHGVSGTVVKEADGSVVWTVNLTVSVGYRPGSRSSRWRNQVLGKQAEAMGKTLVDLLTAGVRIASVNYQTSYSYSMPRWAWVPEHQSLVGESAKWLDTAITPADVKHGDLLYIIGPGGTDAEYPFLLDLWAVRSVSEADGIYVSSRLQPTRFVNQCVAWPTLQALIPIVAVSGLNTRKSCWPRHRAVILLADRSTESVGLRTRNSYPPVVAATVLKA